MDLVRYILSISVVIAHCNIILGTSIYWPVSSGIAVEGFFALSGYLMYGSYMKRNNWFSFVRSRARRIVPPYIKIVVAAALGFSLVSTLTVAEYFSPPGFWKYLGANLLFLNFLHPTLPGCFEGNNVTAVNGSLWTIKVEWALYLTIPLFFFLLRKAKGKSASIACIFTAIGLFSLVYKELMEYLYMTTGKELFHILARQFVAQLYVFYAGVGFAHYADFVSKHKGKLFILCLITFVTLSSLMAGYDSPVIELCYDFLSPPCLAALVIIPSIYYQIKPLANRLGNYSYEI